MKKFAYTIVTIILVILIITVLDKNDNNAKREGTPNTNASDLLSTGGEISNLDSTESESSFNNVNHEEVPKTLLIRVESNSIPKPRDIQSPRIRSKKFTFPKGKLIELKIEDGFSSLDIEPSPSGNSFLVNQDSARKYSIYNSDGELVTNLPLVSKALPKLNPRTQFNWRWVTEKKLVATLGFIHEIKQNQYPESDTIPYDFRFYSYDLDTQQFDEIKIPSINIRDGLLRLNGITEDGFLIISQIPHGEDYWDLNKGNFIGAYRLPD